MRRMLVALAAMLTLSGLSRSLLGRSKKRLKAKLTFRL